MKNTLYVIRAKDGSYLALLETGKCYTEKLEEIWFFSDYEKAEAYLNPDEEIISITSRWNS